MRLICLLIVLAFPLRAHGEEECVEQDYERVEEPDFNCQSPGERTLVPDLDPERTIPVGYGEQFVAPWDGGFVDVDRLIEVGLRVKALRRLRWLDNIRLMGEARLRLEHAERVLAVVKEQHEIRVEQYRRALNEANQRTSRATAWYRSWVFGFLVGIVSAAVVAVLGIYIGISV